MKKVKRIILAVVLMARMLIGFGACNDSSSSYQLHNKDGSINWEYYNDMQDYFAEHPEKLP